MNSVFTLTADDFVCAVIDTRYDVRVVGITDDNLGRVRAKFRDLYGDADFAVQGGEIYIKGNDSLFKPRYSDGDLVHVMKRLTAEDGCPWDRAQTHESIRINAVEEAYELCEAIDNRDVGNIEEEIGDLLLQAVLHSDIAERSDEFTRIDVIDALVRKLVTRHTHIFGDNKASDPESALKFWEAAKAVEKKASSTKEQISRIPESFPALLYAQKVLKKLTKAGLKNTADEISVEELFAAVCGAVKTGADLEVELTRRVRELAADFISGKVTETDGAE